MRLVCILVASMITRSCDLGHPPDESVEHGSAVSQGNCTTSGFQLTYHLTDTLGASKAVFKCGEDFLVKLAITNLTGQAKRFVFSGPVVVFSVRSVDSTVASSEDGLAWPQDVRLDTLEVAETLTFGWRGPNSIAKKPRLSLLPGSYTVAAEFKTAFGGQVVCDPKAVALLVE